jgi:hypothetical protein
MTADFGSHCVPFLNGLKALTLYIHSDFYFNILNFETQFIKPSILAHTSSPSSLGGRDLEDCGLRPAQAKVHETPISINKRWVCQSTSVIPATWGA